jgi:hypothetical protein
MYWTRFFINNTRIAILLLDPVTRIWMIIDDREASKIIYYQWLSVFTAQMQCFYSCLLFPNLPHAQRKFLHTNTMVAMYSTVDSQVWDTAVDKRRVPCPTLVMFQNILLIWIRLAERNLISRCSCHHRVKTLYNFHLTGKLLELISFK